METAKAQPQHHGFLDDHFGVSPQWKDFQKKLKDKSFVLAVQQDTRSDDKLKAFAAALNMRSTKAPSVKAPSDVSGNYRVKYHPQEDRFSCTCPDWTYKRSVGGDDCKHIQRIKSGDSMKTKEAAPSPAEVMFRIGRTVRNEHKEKAHAESLAAGNQAFRQAYPQQSLVQAYLKHAMDHEWAKKIAQAAKRLLG